jgi:hypothetical protein
VGAFLIAISRMGTTRRIWWNLDPRSYSRLFIRQSGDGDEENSLVIFHLKTIYSCDISVTS